MNPQESLEDALIGLFIERVLHPNRCPISHGRPVQQGNAARPGSPVPSECEGLEAYELNQIGAAQAPVRLPVCPAGSEAACAIQRRSGFTGSESTRGSNLGRERRVYIATMRTLARFKRGRNVGIPRLTDACRLLGGGGSALRRCEAALRRDARCDPRRRRQDALSSKRSRSRV